MARGIQLKPDEMEAAFDNEAMRKLYPPILSVRNVAAMFNRSPKTVYQWMSQGRLDGSYRKRGKHNFFWRDRVLDSFFNGPDWN